MPPAHKQAASAAQDGLVAAAPVANTANGRSDDSHGSQQPAVTAPAAASTAPDAAPAQAPGNGQAEDGVQPLDGERKMPRARPKANTADKVAGLPTVGGQRRAQAIAADASIGLGVCCASCHHRAVCHLLMPDVTLHRRRPLPAEAPAARVACRITLQGGPGMQACQGSTAPAGPLPPTLVSQARATALLRRALRSTGRVDSLLHANQSPLR